jgi:ribonuclease PH
MRARRVWRTGRAKDELRPVRITPGFLKYPEGSALIQIGDTRVICSASVEERVPPFLTGMDQGWITAEYAMLPCSTKTRSTRERGPRGRSQEIQRLIGRALRATADLGLLGGRTILVDCDVLQADGGTRTAAITGAYVAVALAERGLRKQKLISRSFLKDQVAALSIGLVDGQVLLDLDYEEDSCAEVDLNIAMTGSGKLVEVQGTAEGQPFSRTMLNRMINIASRGMAELFRIQKEALRTRAR